MEKVHLEFPLPAYESLKNILFRFWQVRHKNMVLCCLFVVVVFLPLLVTSVKLLMMMSISPNGKQVIANSVFKYHSQNSFYEIPFTYCSSKAHFLGSGHTRQICLARALFKNLEQKFQAETWLCAVEWPYCNSMKQICVFFCVEYAAIMNMLWILKHTVSSLFSAAFYLEHVNGVINTLFTCITVRMMMSGFRYRMRAKWPSSMLCTPCYISASFVVFFIVVPCRGFSETRFLNVSKTVSFIKQLLCHNCTAKVSCWHTSCWDTLGSPGPEYIEKYK